MMIGFVAGLLAGATIAWGVVQRQVRTLGERRQRVQEAADAAQAAPMEIPPHILQELKHAPRRMPGQCCGFPSLIKGNRSIVIGGADLGYLKGN